MNGRKHLVCAEVDKLIAAAKGSRNEARRGARCGGARCGVGPNAANLRETAVLSHPYVFLV
jgi:hypothetical protein